MQPTRSLDLSVRLQARRVLQVTLASLALGGPLLALAADPATPKTGPTAQQAPQGTSDKAAAEAAFVKSDVDKDGRLSRTEVANLPAIAARFDELDRDKDGALSMSEYMAALGPMK